MSAESVSQSRVAGGGRPRCDAAQYDREPCGGKIQETLSGYFAERDHIAHRPQAQQEHPGAENDDDLKMSIDIRDLYGTILNRWLNVPVATLGPGPGKILAATPTPDSDGKDYTVFTPLGFLA